MLLDHRSIGVGNSDHRSSTVKRTRVSSKSKKYSQFDKHEPWKLQKSKRISSKTAKQIKDYLAVLRKVELDVIGLDRYVEYSIQKYRPFIFNIQQFMTDELIVSAKFVECYEVTSGQYKGKLFWGQHLDIDKKFEPHGFGILIDEDAKIMQMGTFKQGKENG